METTERKLKKIIEEIGKKQLARCDEKSRKHNPGTEYDVASDNYNWNKLQTYYWTNEAFYHFYKWHDIEQKLSVSIVRLLFPFQTCLTLYCLNCPIPLPYCLKMPLLSILLLSFYFTAELFCSTGSLNMDFLQYWYLC